jgi:type IV pilus assembly protein PilB
MRKKLGEMLVDAGVIDEAQLRSALADQRRWGRSLGRTLVEMRMIGEDALVRVLAQQFGVPSIDLEQHTITAHVLKLVPADLARSARVVPFSQNGRFLDVAMADPQNLGVIDELRIRTQLNIRPYLCGPQQIERAIGRYYSDGLTHEVSIPFEPPDTIEPVAPPRTVNAFADSEGLRRYPRTIAPPPSTAPPTVQRDAEIASLQHRISKLEALVARDEEVLRKLLALLVDKGLATRDEIVERLS